MNKYITTRSNYSFIGWYLDISDTEAYEATTMPDYNLTLYAKWVIYNLNDFKYDDTKLAISEFDTISAALFNAELFDSDGELVEIQAIINGAQEAGQTVSIGLTASGKYDIKKQGIINDIKVYGMPTIVYNNEKDYINLSDTLNNQLFNLSGKDTYNASTTTNVTIESYSAGDLVTVILTSTDIAGNITSVEIENIKVYGEPEITYTHTKTDIKVDDIIGNELWNVTAQDSFGETLSATTEIISGTQAAGNTITMHISSTDTKGNTRNITFDVKVYGTPAIGDPTKTDFKVQDVITVNSLGIAATDSHNGTVADVSIAVKSGTQTAGSIMTYTITAKDLVGNTATKDIDIKIFDTPTFALQTKTDIKTTDDLTSLATFAVSAKDSFNSPLQVDHIRKSGTQTGGTVMTYTFMVIDDAGNSTSVDYPYKVYEQSDITINYTAGATDLIKLTSQGEEFSVTATDSFGESCTIKVLKSDGTAVKSGTTSSIIFRATDAADNYKDTPVISNIKIYGTPIATYAYDYYYLKAVDNNIGFMFTVRDSFNSELDADVTQISYESGIRKVSVTATDDAGNQFEKIYQLCQLADNQSYLALYSGTEFLGYHIVTQGECYSLPVDLAEFSNIQGWQLNSSFITDNYGNSLSKWDKASGGYRLQLITAYQRINASGVPTANDNYILFGEYPQTIKADSVTVGTTANSKGYYLGSDGYYYTKVTAKPYGGSYAFSTGSTVTSGMVYYFKVEPIKWRILSESGGTALILCESIIANKRYDDSSNNYANSEIRAWLNNEFYTKAFTALQQELIQITEVDNSVYSTGYSSNPYVCANTNDKIFLPSYREMVTECYGFSSDSNDYDTARRRLTSDYSRATGAYMNTDTSYYGNGWWWLRSPYSSDSNYARRIYCGGYAAPHSLVRNTYGSVVPALKIRLS